MKSFRKLAGKILCVGVVEEIDCHVKPREGAVLLNVERDWNQAFCGPANLALWTRSEQDASHASSVHMTPRR